MKIAQIIDFFIHGSRKEDPDEYHKARMFVRASLLTSMFSTTYIWLSVFFEYDKGVYLMALNVVGFLLLPLLGRTRLPISILGNMYVSIGAFAVLVLTYYSGGLWSAIYPWIISIPVLALLVVNKLSGIVWGVISFSFMVWYGVLELNQVVLPVEYNPELRSLWFVSIVPGLLLIIMVVSLVFQSMHTKAVKAVRSQNKELERQKEQIILQSKELEKTLEDKDHIIRILAHDLKSPLANIDIVAQLLLKSTKQQEREKLTSILGESTRKSMNLVDKVLDMAILEQDGIRVHLNELNIIKSIDEAVESLKESAKRKNIAILHEKPLEDYAVMADEFYLHQIFENLLSNAIKFSYKGEQVEIRTETNEDKVRAMVMDNGPGIKESEENQLFQRFTRLSAQPTGNESSSGLGLSLVKQYVTKINGDVWYDRSMSKGATFVVELPMANYFG